MGSILGNAPFGSERFDLSMTQFRLRTGRGANANVKFTFGAPLVCRFSSRGGGAFNARLSSSPSSQLDARDPRMR
jgi:hypothetical protein